MITSGWPAGRWLCLAVLGWLATMVATSPAQADFATPAKVSPGTQDTGFAQVALDDAGNAVFVWQASAGSDRRVAVRSRTFAGTLGAGVIISPAGADASSLRVAVDADGDAIIVWTSDDGTTLRVLGRARSRSGTLGPVVILSPTTSRAESPQIDMTSNGRAYISWTETFNDGTR